MTLLMIASRMLGISDQSQIDKVKPYFPQGYLSANTWTASPGGCDVQRVKYPMCSCCTSLREGGGAADPPLADLESYLSRRCLCVLQHWHNPRTACYLPAAQPTADVSSVLPADEVSSRVPSNPFWRPKLKTERHKT